MRLSRLCLTLFLGTSVVSVAMADTADDGLVEVVVTAQRYVSTVQDTPLSISALTGTQLLSAGLSRLTDVVREVPGLSMRSAGPGLTEFEARGLASTGGAAPTVGFYLDDTPLSPPALSQSGKFVIDPNLYDLERVEVLRGPQGTLYGSGSMGGTVKVITLAPTSERVEGSVQVTGSLTGARSNGSVDGMLNLPVNDSLAIRLVGSDLYRAGWIDRVVVSPFPAEQGATRGDVLAAPVSSRTTDVNTEHLTSERVSIRYAPAGGWVWLGSMLTQNLRMGGYDLIDVPPGSKVKAHFEAFDTPEPVTDAVRLYSLTVKGPLAGAELTSATSYWNRSVVQTQDAAESLAVTIGAAPVALGFQQTDASHQFSQELRLMSTWHGRLRWTAGAFFSDMTSVWREYGANPVHNAVPDGVYFAADNPYRIREQALYVDGSVALTDAWTLSAGLRWYGYTSTIAVSQWGALTPDPVRPIHPTLTRASDTGYNPRLNLAYAPSGDLDVYLSVARGFRPGGANILVPPPNQVPYCPAGTPEAFGPDSVWNAEVGEKARFFGGRVSVHGDVYYLRWHDVQQSVPLACGFVYNTNAGDARSVGSELELNARLTDQWSLALSGTVTRARIDSPTTAYASSLVGVNGQPYCSGADRCPIPILNVPSTSAALSIVYTAHIGPDVEMTVRASDSYTGAATDEAYAFGVHLPPYDIGAVRLTLAKGAWSVDAFVDNVADRTALMTANNTQFQYNIAQLTRYATNQPRTVGMRVRWTF